MCTLAGSGTSKVIGFDGWTLGAHHYERLVEACGKRGMDLLLIHLGSWGNEKNRPAEEMIGKLPVRDISYYSKGGLANILDIEKPAAVIFLSMDAFAHRAFNRYCRKKNIPTIHLNHGIRSVFDTNSSVPFRYSFLSRLCAQKEHLLKQLRYFLPIYAKSLWDTNASIGEWSCFLSDILIRISGLTSMASTDDSRTNRHCVYIESDIEYAMDKYKYLYDEIVTVGNPDLISFGLTTELVGSCLGTKSYLENDVMYIDTANIDYGVIFHSKYEFIQHIIDTRNQLLIQGKRLLFKPHPGSIKHNIISPLSDAGIDICTNKDFVTRLQGCCACITEPSSAALIPALMAVPLFLAQYGKYEGQSFGDLLTSYPRARPLSDLHEFNSLLAAEQANFDSERTMQWIGHNAGPLPVEEMPGRVANVVLSLITEDS